MNWRGRLQCVAMLLSFLISFGGNLWCADRQGTFDADCGHYTFFLKTPRDGSAGSAPEAVMTLRMGIGSPVPLEQFVGLDWKASGRICVLNSNQCDEAASVKIRIESVSKNGKHASGTFVVDFPDGKHEEGRLEAKYHHEGPKPTCE